MPRILIVDDEPEIASIVSATLRRAGYDVQTAVDPEEAFKMCAGESFDLVLSDVQMPRMNGHELARRLAQPCPRTRVVLMSGSDPGCDDCPYSPQCNFVGKPFDVRNLIHFVSTVLAKPLPELRGQSSSAD